MRVDGRAGGRRSSWAGCLESSISYEPSHFAYFCVLSCSVLESDPEFGFEEAKRQLEGIQESVLLLVFLRDDV